ncbi:hypothetical protein FRC12_016665 [Ceratobasidium sp. 428]|nr:hypothetical protein FRC12_016665 [Ceratobasidium sp. 428]
MLRFSSLPLPAEIYAMIYSHLSVNHLAAIQKTCRQLYTITTPYVWQSVDIESLLRLLPGCTSELGRNPKLEIATPCPIPDSYFDRFFYYSRFVKCAKITPQFIISGSFKDDSSEVAVLAKTTGHLTLPILREVKLTMIVNNNQRGYRDEYDDYGFWIEALIPQEIKRISFEAYSNYNESLLQALMARAPKLSHLEFASEVRSSRFYDEVVGSSATQNVRSLQYSGSIMDPDVLQWFAEMSQLVTLELTLDQDDSEEPDIPQIDYQPEAFQALTTLGVFTCDHGDVAEQWNLLKQIWKTPLVNRLTCVELKLSEPIHPGTEEFDEFLSILVAHSPHISTLQIGASGRPENFPEILVDCLSGIHQLPLQTLNLQSPIRPGAGQLLFKTLGETFAKLESLDLGTTSVEVLDLLSAHSHLPKLRYLNVGLWQTKTNREKLERTLFSKRINSFVFPAQPPYGSSLSLCFRERKSTPSIRTYNLDFCDIDLLAILLAARWASIYVHGSLLADRMAALRARVLFWQCKAYRGWEQLVDCMLKLSRRS